MISFRSSSIALLLICSSIYSSENEEMCPDEERPQRFTIRHIEKGGIGYEDGYTSFEAFLSHPGQWTVTPFLDARGHIFDDGKWAANAGIGLRAIWGERIYGLNTYYDYRNVSHLQCNQMGVGLETLGALVDFRVNGYFPFGKTTSQPWGGTFVGFSGHNMIISEKLQVVMTGTDAEFGFHFGKSERFDFYAAAGPYYFRGDIGPNVWGGKARIAGKYKELITLEISDSYDTTFHNRVQGQISLSYSIGPKSKVKKEKAVTTCQLASTLNTRIVQPVDRQEIIVVDKKKKNAAAIDPATGLPYFFVFVDNTSSSNGTYESPYHALAQAQNNSSPNDIIYVFPGDGTTTGMNAGIFLQANQKFWCSGVSHSLQAAQGAISIPAQTSASPTITNTDPDTEGNAITLATNNAISGFTITSALNDAIIGTNAQNLEVSSCLFENTTTYPIQATFSGDASISLTNNQFSNNVNGVFLTLNGTSTVICSNNTFEGQTSVSNMPLEIVANSNTFTTQIENNLFNANMTGAIRIAPNDVVSADIRLFNNTITNNDTGSQSTLGSSFVIIATGTTDDCSIALRDNTFSGNTSYAVYLHTSGAFTTLDIAASSNTMSDNGGSALAIAPTIDALTLSVTDNTITECGDNAIAIVETPIIETVEINIKNNTITTITGNGISLARPMTTATVTITDNVISDCTGTGILLYPSASIFSDLTIDVSDNTVSDCQNEGSNAASGLDIEQYINLSANVTNNIFSGNLGTSVVIASTLTSPESPTVCLTLSGNSNSTDYSLDQPDGGVYNLAPCNVDDVNTGTINRPETITPVQSCPGASACP